MTKDQLIFTIINEVIGQAPNQDSSRQAHPQDIEYEVEKAYNSIVKQFFMDPKNAELFDLNYFSNDYTANVSKISEDTYYAALPVMPISLPNGMGIRLITPIDSDVNIERITEGMFHVLKNLEAYCCSPNAFAYIDKSNSRVVFKFNRPEYAIIEQVTLKIIPTFSGLAGDDEIQSPVGEVEISKMVLELMGHRPTDNTNDDLR